MTTSTLSFKYDSRTADGTLLLKAEVPYPCQDLGDALLVWCLVGPALAWQHPGTDIWHVVPVAVIKRHLTPVTPSTQEPSV